MQKNSSVFFYCNNGTKYVPLGRNTPRDCTNKLIELLQRKIAPELADAVEERNLLKKNKVILASRSPCYSDFSGQD